jgi:hypothetical protein
VTDDSHALIGRSPFVNNYTDSSLLSIFGRKFNPFTFLSVSMDWEIHNPQRSPSLRGRSRLF